LVWEVSAIDQAEGGPSSGGLTPELRAEQVSVTQSAVGKVVADASRLEHSYAGSIICEQAELGQSATASVQADTAILRESAAAFVRAGQARLEQASAGVVVAETVSGEELRCGVLSAARVEGNVRCLIDNWWIAVGGGLALGVGLAVAGLLLGQRKGQD